MGMLAFTASELKTTQSLDHWGFDDHQRHYSQHGPILNVASLLYFLLLLPVNALRYLDRASLVWFVDMVLFYKHEALKVLDNMARGLPQEEHALQTSYTFRRERLQRPALSY